MAQQQYRLSAGWGAPVCLKVMRRPTLSRRKAWVGCPVSEAVAAYPAGGRAYERVEQEEVQLEALGSWKRVTGENIADFRCYQALPKSQDEPACPQTG